MAMPPPPDEGPAVPGAAPPPAAPPPEGAELAPPPPPLHHCGAAPAGASSFTLNLDGSFSYTPTAGFSGIDTFMYTANDADGPSEPALVSIEVAADATPCPNDGSLCYSTSSDRTNPLLLEGTNVTGLIYVFVMPLSPVKKVKWYMDSPINQANLLSADTTAPYDFMGGSVATANALDTGTLSLGPHTITGKLVFKTDPVTRQDVPATFTVE